MVNHQKFKLELLPDNAAFCNTGENRCPRFDLLNKLSWVTEKVMHLYLHQLYIVYTIF